MSKDGTNYSSNLCEVLGVDGEILRVSAEEKENAFQKYSALNINRKK